MVGRAMPHGTYSIFLSTCWLLILFVLVPAARADEQTVTANPDAAHARLFKENSYPSATTCGDCHPKHYREWSVLQHAYAQMSPGFNAMHGKGFKLANGTNGDFCIRCHTPVGMNFGENEFISNIDRYSRSHEGITCNDCHRVNQSYGKLSGRLTIIKGNLAEPIYRPTGENAGLETAIEKGGLVRNDKREGRKVHRKKARFFQLATSGHCGTCHDVTLANGFRWKRRLASTRARRRPRKASLVKTATWARSRVVCSRIGTIPISKKRTTISGPPPKWADRACNFLKKRSGCFVNWSNIDPVIT